MHPRSSTIPGQVTIPSPQSTGHMLVQVMNPRLSGRSEGMHVSGILQPLESRLPGHCMLLVPHVAVAELQEIGQLLGHVSSPELAGSAMGVQKYPMLQPRSFSPLLHCISPSPHVTGQVLGHVIYPLLSAYIEGIQ